MSLDRIQILTKAYADERSALAAVVTALKLELERTQARFLPGIKAAIARAADARAALEGEVDGHRDLFEKPKTHTWHGIRVGLMKAADEIERDDDALVVTLIESNLQAKAELLIKVEKELREKALGALSEDELRIIACRRKPGTDQVHIKAADDGVDKLVAALLKEDEKRQKEAA